MSKPYRWWIEVHAVPSTLAKVIEAHPPGEDFPPAFWMHKDRCFYGSARVNLEEVAADAHAVARAEIRAINGLYWVEDRSFQALDVRGIQSGTEDGPGDHHVALGMVDASPNMMPIPIAAGEVATTLYEDDSSKIFRLFSRQPLDWDDMYRIYEMLGKRFDFSRTLRFKGDEENRFTASANRPEVSGDDARHGHLKGDPPKRTMTVVEARKLIRRLVTEYRSHLLKSKADS